MTTQTETQTTTTGNDTGKNGRRALVAGMALAALTLLGGPGCALETNNLDNAALAPAAGPTSLPALPARELCPSLSDAASAPLVAAPATLNETGLYCDSARFATAPDVLAFRPRNELWSDGAQKSRWIQLPAGTTIDATDVDHWSFPVGTRVWKEFKYLGRRVETRFIARVGAGASDFIFAAYRWNDSETEATLVAPEGQKAVAPMLADGTGPKHDIPSLSDCKGCHERLPERILGLGAIQSSHDLGGLNLGALIDQGLIAPAPPVRSYAIPGDATAQAALGYLHANCSHCHNDTPSGVTFPRYAVRLHTTDTTVESTAVYRTAVNVLHTWLGAPEGVGPYRIWGGRPEDSELYYRTGVRDPDLQMPPVGTALVDNAGHEVLRAWIASLPAPIAPAGW